MAILADSGIQSRTLRLAEQAREWQVVNMFVVEQLSRAGLQPVSLHVKARGCVSLQGPSGAGKTLLLRALADLDPSAGRITLDGVERNDISGPAWRRRVAYVPAEAGWWANTVGSHFDDWSAALPLMTRLGIPDAARDWPVAQASTGERQRLALVRALVKAPKMLLLDEPTSGLDRAATEQVEALISEQRAGGVGVLWVSHDPAQAARVADHALMIDHGQVREAG